MESNRILNNQLLGSYLQAFFCINLNTDDSLDNLNKLDNQTISTLLHEYIHFLQDITTTFGLTNIIAQVNHQKSINLAIIESESDSFETPVEIDFTSESAIYNDLHSIFVGEFNSTFNSYSSITQCEILRNELVIGLEHFPYVLVHFETFSEKGSFNFGAIQIMESMAYIIERNMFEKVNTPTYPYHIVEKVIEFVYPEILGNDALIVSICDYSLMVPDPGRFFIKFLNDLKLQNISDVNEAFALFKRTTVRLPDSNLSVFKYYSVRCGDALQSLTDYFTVDYFEDVNQWFNQIFENIGNFRLKKFNFWSEVLSGISKIQNRNNFIKLTLQFGFPLIINNKGQAVFSNPQGLYPSNILALRAIKEVSEILSNNQSECQMIHICKNGLKDITNESCKTPWERGMQDPLCPFGQIIKMWGIHTKTPVSQ